MTRPPEAPNGGRTGVVHACPTDGSAVMACCSRNPFEPEVRRDRLTRNPQDVTCKGKDEE